MAAVKGIPAGYEIAEVLSRAKLPQSESDLLLLVVVRPAGTQAKLPEVEDASPEAQAVRRIFDHYLMVWPKKGRYDLTPKRREKIKTRLGEFSEDEIKAALTRSKFDDWPERVNHSDIEVLLKSREACERWLNFVPKGGPRVSAGDLARFKGSTFSEWQASVARVADQLDRDAYPTSEAFNLACRREASARGYGWEMDPPPSSTSPDGHPWKGWR